MGARLRAGGRRAGNLTGLSRARKSRFTWAWLGIAGAFAAAAALALALYSSDSSNGASRHGPWIGVKGNQLIDRGGRPVRLLGVNRPGAEYQCVEADQIFEGPTDPAAIRAMKRWRINAVRVPLNESCWLGRGEVKPALSGAPYREAIRDFVHRLERAGLYVILDLHWAAPGRFTATGLIPQADADHALEFWRSVATEFRSDRSIVFDAYNEPHDISWQCWRDGCEAYDHWFGHYRAAGMAQLVEAIRSTGAEQPIMLGGLDWAHEMRGWLAHVPADPANAIVASNHSYNDKPCRRRCRALLARIAKRYPLVTGELGQKNCRHNYVDSYMRWADRHGVSYLAWAWYTAPYLTCRNGPIVIENFAGKPTPYGIGFREHFRRLHRGRSG